MLGLNTTEFSSMSTRRDTERALHLLYSYQAELGSPEQQQLRTSLQQVLCMLRSDLFQALLDIQEWYEVMLRCTQSEATEHSQMEPYQSKRMQDPENPQTQGEMPSGLEIQCVRVMARTTEQKERALTLLSPLHTTLPKGPLIR
ncbi:hypothetical protein XELAEV_18038672mg [Xenopus laevis]|uniref:L27 domain-containing protein n=1 Tax=Xenopus laevis TaxID=8355 RepID=A0A974C6L9_XENLA|nr:hypothetical protein XELAEV_18038672mg [Xenopus laevis]